MLFSGLEILGRRSKLKFLDHAFLYSGEGIVAFNISLRSTKFVTRSTVIAVACGARARSSHSTAAGLVLQDLKPHTKLTGKAHFICCAVSCRIATCGWTTILCLSETGPLRLLRSAHYRLSLFDRLSGHHCKGLSAPCKFACCLALFASLYSSQFRVACVS